MTRTLTRSKRRHWDAGFGGHNGTKYMYYVCAEQGYITVTDRRFNECVFSAQIGC